MKEYYKIIDNLFSDEESQFVENKILPVNSCFPWFFSPKTITNNDNQKDIPCFYHQLIINNKSESQFSELFLNIFLKKYYSLRQKLEKELTPNFNQIYNMRVNLSLSYTNFFGERKTPIHVDRKFDHIVLIYYVNTSDGDTVLVNNQTNKKIKVTPKRGRILVFNGGINHYAISSKKTKQRALINFNLGFEYENSNYW